MKELLTIILVLSIGIGLSYFLTIHTAYPHFSDTSILPTDFNNPWNIAWGVFVLVVVIVFFIINL